jgi:hypothetical protein
MRCRRRGEEKRGRGENRREAKVENKSEDK